MPDPTDHTARIEINGTGPGTIEVNGVDISHAVRSVSVDAKAGGTPHILLALDVHDVSTWAGPTQLLVPDETAAALVAIGWTPPGQQPPDGWLAEALTSRLHRDAVAREVRRLARVDHQWHRSLMGH